MLDGLPKWSEHKDTSELMSETASEEQGAAGGDHPLVDRLSPSANQWRAVVDR